jgi:hypothetical protein
VGAALLGFDALGTGTPAVVARLRAALTEAAIAPMEIHQ